MGKRMFQSGACLVMGMLLAPAGSAAVTPNKPGTDRRPWVFRADWTVGYAGWMSFPLAQDIGYDPTIFTEKQGTSTVLQHEFLSHGEPRPWFGMVRPLEFSAGAQSEITLRYRLDTAGTTMRPLELVLNGVDGRHYTTALPAGPGEHTVRIAGAQMHLTAETPIQAIILRGRLQHPSLDSVSRWTLEEFVLHAERAPEVALSLPQLNATVDGSWVATSTVARGGELTVERKSSGLPARIALYNGAGDLVVQHDGAAGETRWSVPVGADAAPGLWRAEITEGQAHTAFRFLVLGDIAPHPRLLLTTSRLDELREQPRYADLRKQIHQRAEAMAAKITYNAAAGDNIEMMPSGQGIRPAWPGQLKPYIELVEAYADAVAYNALDYRLNGNKKALVSARRALATMDKWQTWVPPRFQNHGLSTYYEVGVTAQRVAFGYDLIADELSPEEKENTANALWERVVRPTVEEYFSSNRDPIAASNWMANSVGGALEAAIAVAGDTPGWNQREAPAVAKLIFAYEQLLQGLFPGDGSEAEPYGYENFAMQGMSWGISSLAALHIRPAGADRMIAGFWWPYYVTVRPGLQLDTGDFNGHLTGLPGFAWGTAFTGIPELQALYDTGTHLDLSKGADAGQNGHLLEENLGPIDLACCSKAVPAFTAPPPSRVFPLRGSAALRSGWDADATVISLRVGPWFNHQHNDEGSFQVAAFGAELIDEAGYGNYYTDPRYADYFTQAAGHNALLIDGNAFSQTAIAGRFWAGFEHPHFTSQMLSQTIDYLSADLTSAYDGVLQKYQRQFFFLKPGILIVHDTVSASEAHTFSWLLHSPPNSKLSSEGATASIQVKEANASITATGKNSAWTTAITPIQATMFTDLDRQHIEPRQELILTSPKTTETQFMVGMKFAAGVADVKAPLEAWSEPAGDGLRTAGASVVFRSGTGKLNLDTLSTDGSAFARQEGNWLAIGAKDVDEGGQAIFRADMPADVTWEPVVAGMELTVHTAAKNVLQIFSDTAPVSVSVDGQPIPIIYEGKMIRVPLPLPGEHHVSIH
ncbi:MAG TPA: heparinase II/III family protein [Acidobacteriaceae bacterium]|nr:heparinase II/III family protein [Acidobacteriaceae bacterium]